MKKVFFVIYIMAIAISVATSAWCADEAKQAPQGAGAGSSPAKRPMPPQMDRNFVFIMGSVTKIDTSVPDNTKIEVMNEADNKSHVVEVGPATNILKVIDATELKTGEKVRVMARKVDNKEVAMSVVTGKLKELPRPPKPVTPPTAQAPTAKQQPTVKK